MINLYGVFDKKAQSFCFIFEADNNELAKRNMYRLLERGNNDFVKFPYDFNVQCIGFFDRDTGLIKACSPCVIAFEVASLFKSSSPETVEDYSGEETSPSVSED